MNIFEWLQGNYVEVFGAVTGIIYVFLEIRQKIWLWPVGITTSAVYIIVFFTSKFYADMSLQVYYLVISILGWYWWVRGGKGRNNEAERGRAGSSGESVKAEKGDELKVTRLKPGTGVYVFIAFFFLYALMWIILSKFTDSPVPGWDSFITSLSVVATWMLARKIFEHWYLWVIVNSVSAFIFFARGLYPTVLLYVIYAVMSVAGIIEWKKSIETK